MNTRRIPLGTVPLLIVALAFATSASAQLLLYDDLAGSSDQMVNFSTGSLQVGNDITLNQTNAICTNFVVQYFFDAPEGVNGDETAQVRFYLNDGPIVSGSPSPGTVVYDSGVFDMSLLPYNGVTNRALLDFDLTPTGGNATNVTRALSSFTWTIQFNNLSGSESAGLTIYDPASTGGNHPTYWQNDGTAWSLQQVVGHPSNFGSQVYGTLLQMTTASASGGHGHVTFPGVGGYSYIVQRSTNLVSGAGWVSISTNAVSTTGPFTVTDTFPDIGSQPRYALYRLMLQ